MRIYHITSEQTFRLGTHAASVNALLPVSPTQVVSSGSDGFLKLWDISTHECTKTQQFPASLHAICAPPVGQNLALMSDRLMLFDWQSWMQTGRNLNISTQRGVRPSPARCSTFASQSSLLVGQYNGQVIHYDLEKHPIRRTIFTEHAGRIVGLQTVPNTSRVISASSDADIRYTRFASPRETQSLAAPVTDLTSLFVAASGHFMATGSMNNLTLWDMRPQNIPDILETPLAELDPNDIVVIRELLDVPLPEEIHRALELMRLILEKRFQYEIELGDLAQIHPGEYDIVLEDVIDE